MCGKSTESTEGRVAMSSSRLVAVGAVSAALLAGCGGEDSQESAVPSAAVSTAADTITLETVTLGAGTPIVTVEATEDIVAWGSYVLAVEAVAESERHTSPIGPGETMIGRDVTVQVREVLWSHPQAVTEVKAGEQLSVYTFPGFLQTNERTVPAVEEGQVRMAIGEAYVLVMADDTTTEGDQILTLLSTLEPDDSIVRLPDGTDIGLEAERARLAEATSAAPADSGPRRGESLVQRLERRTDPG